MADVKILKELECPICHETYGIPKMLDCMHTFCENCIKGMIETTQWINCPYCLCDRKIIEYVAHNSAWTCCGYCGRMPTYICKLDGCVNHDICDECASQRVKEKTSNKCLECDYVSQSAYSNYVILRDLEKRRNAEEKPKCQDCVGEVDATDYCRECQCKLCPDCTKYHQRSQRYRRHQIVNIKDAPTDPFAQNIFFCKDHDELMKYFCEDCKFTVCNDCQLSTGHRGHQFSLVSEVQERVKTNIAERVKEAKSVKEILNGHVECGKKFIDQIKEEDEKSIALVNEIIEEVKEALMKRRDEIIKQIHEESNTKSFDEFSKSTNILNSLLTYVRSLDSCADVEINSILDAQLQATLEKLGSKEILQFHVGGFKAPCATALGQPNAIGFGNNVQGSAINNIKPDSMQQLASTTGTKKSFIVYKRHRPKHPDCESQIESTVKHIFKI